MTTSEDNLRHSVDRNVERGCLGVTTELLLFEVLECDDRALPLRIMRLAGTGCMLSLAETKPMVYYQEYIREDQMLPVSNYSVAVPSI